MLRRGTTAMPRLLNSVARHVWGVLSLASYASMRFSDIHLPNKDAVSVEEDHDMHACAAIGERDHAVRMGPSACAAEPGAQGSARRDNAAQSAADAGTAPMPGVPASGLVQGLGLGRAGTAEREPPGMRAPGALSEQGRLSSEPNADHDSAAGCAIHSLPEHCQHREVASAKEGACANGQLLSGQAEQAAGTEAGNAEDGWSDFQG